MKKFFINVIMALLAIHAGAEELNWKTSVPEALEQAKKENKTVLLDFTGSDWCGWCMRLNKEIFDTTEFKNYAKTNLVLVEIDFPMRKKQSAELKKTNAALQAKYGVRGYPTLIILNAEGKQIGQMGYMRGGPEPFITRLNKIKEKGSE